MLGSSYKMGKGPFRPPSHRYHVSFPYRASLSFVISFSQFCAASQFWYRLACVIWACTASAFFSQALIRRWPHSFVVVFIPS